MMRLVLLGLLCCNSISFAAKSKEAPSWFCYKGEDNSGQTVEGCERALTACQTTTSLLPDFNTTPICYPRNKAWVFSYTHKSSGVVEELAFPDLAACFFTAEDMARNSDGDVMVSACKSVK